MLLSCNMIIPYNGKGVIESDSMNGNVMITCLERVKEEEENVYI